MKLKFISLTILLMPVILFGQPKTRMYGDGNTSVKINDSQNYLNDSGKRILLENSALAFSGNGAELYFRHPTDKYFQVWSIASKQKLSEITFSEAGNTAKGREVIASFPNIIYKEDEYANSIIWLSADLSITFDDRNNFKIYSGENQAEKSFRLKLRNTISDKTYADYEKFYKKADLVNTGYQMYFHKKLNKLFIIAYADQRREHKREYFSTPYNGVFCFDLASNTLNVLAENPNCVGGGTTGYFTDRWYFFTSYLVHSYVRANDWGTPGQSYFKRFSLETLTSKDLEYATNFRIPTQKEPDGWQYTFVGTDLQDNLYVVNPHNNHIEIHCFDNSGKPKGILATILNSSNKQNRVHYDKVETAFVKQYDHTAIRNVIAGSPSGKYFAYLCINNRTFFGNYASIMLYNLDESDRVYTLNDQTKFQPYIAKGYVTNSESEALEIKWQKYGDSIAVVNSNQQAAAKQERLARYAPKLDALKWQYLELKKERDASIKEDFELYKLGNFKAVLVRNKWSAREIYKPYSTSPSSHNFYANEELSFRYSSTGVYADIKEVLTFPVSKKTDKHLLLTGDPGFNERYVEGVTKGAQYITTNFNDIPLIDWKGDECRTNTDAPSLSQVKGQDIIEQGESFKYFSSLYRGSLLKARFKLSLLANNTFLLTVKASTGVSFNLEIPKTAQQSTLDGKLNDLRMEIKKLEDLAENGN